MTQAATSRRRPTGRACRAALPRYRSRQALNTTKGRRDGDPEPAFRIYRATADSGGREVRATPAETDYGATPL